jgi:hypothetical protein
MNDESEQPSDGQRDEVSDRDGWLAEQVRLLVHEDGRGL